MKFVSPSIELFFDACPALSFPPQRNYGNFAAASPPEREPSSRAAGYISIPRARPIQSTGIYIRSKDWLSHKSGLHPMGMPGECDYGLMTDPFPYKIGMMRQTNYRSSLRYTGKRLICHIPFLSYPYPFIGSKGIIRAGYI